MRRPHIFHGWFVLAGGFTITVVAYAMRNTFSVFYPVIVEHGDLMPRFDQELRLCAQHGRRAAAGGIASDQSDLHAVSAFLP